MAVEPWLADQELDTASELGGDAIDGGADIVEALRAASRCGLAHAGRGAILAKHATQRRRPFTRGHADLGAGDRRLHDVAAVFGRILEALERLGNGVGIARGTPGLEPFYLFRLERWIDHHNRAFAGR